MKVLILAGGKGSRLSVEDKPKPLMEIGGKPIIWHIMSIYANSGFKDFVILLGYKGQMIKDYFSSHPEPNWNIDFLNTGLETKKAQRIKKAEYLIDSDCFFVAYGDDLSDVDPKSIFEFHKKHGKVATLTAMPLESNFGVVEIGGDDDVKCFREKPRIEGYWINGGFFCFSKKIFDYFTDNEELEDEIFQKLTKMGEIKAYKHGGFWKCLNTKKDSIEFDNLILENNAPWIKW
ncbi:MAG: NTP transferase domain-containing protein [Saprospiraceae bacterium]|nr:NTP transferase domain-containing protein [Saprospiraceae bacterium]